MFTELIQALMPDGCPVCKSELVVTEYNWNANVVQSFTQIAAVAGSFLEVFLHCTNCDTSITHRRSGENMLRIS